jgi:hypothetical protein
MVMVRSLILLAVAVGTVTACSPSDFDPREQARAVVNADMERRFPGVDVSPVTDCVIDNATNSELFALAGSAASGNSGAGVQTISEILQRPATLRCTAVTFLGRQLL